MGEVILTWGWEALKIEVAIGQEPWNICIHPPQRRLPNALILRHYRLLLPKDRGWRIMWCRCSYSLHWQTSNLHSEVTTQSSCGSVLYCWPEKYQRDLWSPESELCPKLDGWVKPLLPSNLYCWKPRYSVSSHQTGLWHKHRQFSSRGWSSSSSSPGSSGGSGVPWLQKLVWWTWNCFVTSELSLTPQSPEQHLWYLTEELSPLALFSS